MAKRLIFIPGMFANLRPKLIKLLTFTDEPIRFFNSLNISAVVIYQLNFSSSIKQVN